MAGSKNIIIAAQRFFIVSLVLLVTVAYSSIAGCGRKGPPLPEKSSMPSSVSALEASLDGGNVVLRWKIADHSKKEPAGFFISRGYVGCATCPVRAVPIARVSYKTEAVFTFIDMPKSPGRYEYRVGCVDEHGIEGPVSTVAVFLPPDAGLRAVPEEDLR